MEEEEDESSADRTTLFHADLCTKRSALARRSLSWLLVEGELTVFLLAVVVGVRRFGRGVDIGGGKFIGLLCSLSR